MVVNIFNFSAQEAAAGGSREFEASLVYISSFRIPRAIAQRNSVLRNKAKQNAMFTHPRE